VDCGQGRQGENQGDESLGGDSKKSHSQNIRSFLRDNYGHQRTVTSAQIESASR
jgi:hypothetical protein